MKIAIGSDHRGFLLKEKIKKFLKRGGHSIYDAGCSSNESVDYPVFAEKVGKAINKNQAEKGILICGSGIGMSIA
ncbi:MAG: RpiB/LacA/LacB family sugar-phosphate isomerase, partial [Elusimicrobiota bacterium]